MISLGKRKYKIFSNGLDDKTIYLGTEKGKSHIRIYNKKKEANLNITGDLTRVEITTNIDSFLISDVVLWNYETGFPDLFLNNYVYSLSDFEEKKEKDKTFFAILYAVQNGYSLNDLTRQYRKRIKEMLQRWLSDKI